MRLLYEPLTDIPIEFTEVEYIQSNGTQYIDVGLKANGNTGLDIIFSNSITNDLPVLGSRTSWSSNSFSINWANGKYAFNYGNYALSQNLTTNVSIDTNKHTASIRSGGVCKFDSWSYTFGNYTFTTPNNIVLFSLDNNGTIVFTQANINIYMCKIYDGDVLVRNFVPCLDNNNVPCMYDKVEGKAYYNAGTGTFSYGREIHRVEYIENLQADSSRNWINTRIVTDNTTKWEVKISYNDTNTGKLMGSGIGGDTRFNLGIESNKFRFGFGGGWFDANSQVYTPDTEPHVWVLDCSTKTGTIDGHSAVSTSTFGTNTYPIALFGRTNNDNSIESSNTTVGKIYYSKIWKNNILVSDMIPVRDENNVGYMFDKVTHTLYANAGTGSLTYGPELPKKKLRLIRESNRRVPAGFTEVEYLQSSGTQYIDTGYKPNNNTEYEVSGYMNPSGVFGVARWSGEPTYDTFGAHSITANPLDYYGRYSSNKYLNLPSSVFSKQIVWKHTSTNISVKNAIDGTSYVNQNIVTDTFQSTYNLWIFGFNNMGTILSRNVGCKINAFKIWDNGVLIRDYIPCLDTNNVPCLWDIVEQKAYYNSGSGSFTYGNQIIPVEYIESTGTQYIDTGIIAKSGLSSRINFEYTALDTNSISMLDARSGNDRFYLCHAGNSNGYWFYYGYGGAVQSSVHPTANTKYFVETSLKSGSQIMKVNGETILSGTSETSYNLNVNLYLFGINYTTPQFLAKAKLYSCKIFDNEILVRDYIPVRDENNVGYLLDRLTHTLIGNVGTGSFGVGNELKDKIRFLEGE